MTNYRVTLEVTGKAKVAEVYYVEATSLDEAEEKVWEGGGEFVEDYVIEVLSYDDEVITDVRSMK
jgi:aminoglycoside phosphotransferase family enzyme